MASSQLLAELSSGCVRQATCNTVEALPSLQPSWLESARNSPNGLSRHKRLASSSGVMDVVRIKQAPTLTEEDASPGTITIAAWNLERCKHVAESALLMKRHKVDIALLTEMDIGMARSGNIDTVSSLAHSLSMGHAFATEFIELGLGDLREQQNHSDQLNTFHLHGNAVISRYPFQQAAVIPLDKGGL